MKHRWTVMLAAALGFLAVAAYAENKKDAAKADYPLDTCVVSGEKLGNHGDVFVLNYEGREIRMCCKGCKKDFLKEPEKYLKKLDEAAAKKAADAAAKLADAPKPEAK